MIEDTTRRARVWWKVERLGKVADECSPRRKLDILAVEGMSYNLFYTEDNSDVSLVLLIK
jgi:hypothetical protein